MFFLTQLHEYFRMAWTALRSHKLRSILTTLGIVIGVTTIITIWTTIEGLNEYVHGELSYIGSSSVYIEKWPWVIQGDFWKYRNRKDITYKEYEAVEEFSTIADYISPEVYSAKSVTYKTEKFQNVFIIGTTEDYIETANAFPEVGRFLTELDVRYKVPVVVLGNELSANLFGLENPIGKRIKIGGRKYRVVGVLERKGSFFGQSMDDYAIVPIGTFRRVYGGHRGLRITVTTNEPEQLEAMKDELRGIMRRVRKIPPAEEDDFAINQMDMLSELYSQLTSTLFAIVFVIGGISLVVGGIGIMNIMLVSVTERTREIGIRKSVGAKRISILSQFLFEAIAISSLGGFIGLVLGFIGGTIVLSQMDLTSGVSLTSILIGFGFSTTVGIVSGFYPAFKASKMNPIESLRYE
jgi:putative ABC transport system permease protein